MVSGLFHRQCDQSVTRMHFLLITYPPAAGYPYEFIGFLLKAISVAELV